MAYALYPLETTKSHIFELNTDIEQIALLLFASKANHQTLAEGKLMLVSELMVEIANYIKGKKVAKEAVPEQFPLLRTIQFMMEYSDQIFNSLK